MQGKATVQLDTSEGAAPRIILSGELTFSTASYLWTATTACLRDISASRLIVDGSSAARIDSAGIAYLIWLRKRGRRDGFDVEFAGFSDDVLEQADAMECDDTVRDTSGDSFLVSSVEKVGSFAAGMWQEFYALTAYTGELLTALGSIIVRPRKFRFNDAMIVFEMSGADAIGISFLLGLLFGLILSFQGAVSLKMFGADIYVVDLVVLGMFRVMGSFVAAILYASRSGSAFAAELATMKVNEEIDALTTMGLSPVQFLVIPRVVVAIIVLPMLALIVNFAALFGCIAVMSSMGYPLAMLWNEMSHASSLSVFVSGFVKAFVYGYLIASVGCFRGLTAGSGPRAVGQASTSAVVTSIVLIVVTEGIFAVVYYLVGI